MELVYVERATADTDDTRLRLILEARARAAERCVEANHHATNIRRDLTQHLARRLQEGAVGSTLRRKLIDSGINETMAGEIMRAASSPDVFTIHSDPRQQVLPYG